MLELVGLMGVLVLGMILAEGVLKKDQSTRFQRYFQLWVVRVALPALVLQKIRTLSDFSFLDPRIFIPISQPWIHFFLSAVVVSILSFYLRWERRLWLTLVLTVGLGNTSFVGFPLLRATLGSDSLVHAALTDQFGTFFVFALIAIPFAEGLAREKTEKRSSVLAVFLNLLKSPSLFSLLMALISRGVVFSNGLERLLDGVAMTLSPAAFFSVGLGLRPSFFRREKLSCPLLLGLALKLLFFPFVYWGLYSWWCSSYPDFPELILKVTILEGAMATMILAGVLVSLNRLEVQLAQQMIALSILLSLITVPAWLWVISNF